MNIISLYCLLTSVKDPPSIVFENEYFQAYPINRELCPHINPSKDVTFDLYTRDKPSEPSPLQIDNDELFKSSGFNPNTETIIFFHGFLETSHSADGIGIKNAYLQRNEGYNVILVNAKLLVAGPWYANSVLNCIAIGKYTALLVDYLVSKGMPLSTLHIIGHSLGAHMAGNTASNIKSGRVSRLTALDPAGPLYTFLSSRNKLDITDADFVVVIHTDMNVFGSSQAGHVNFFPNGGHGIQPGCSIPEVIHRSPGKVSELLFCSHWRSYQYYIESVLDDKAFLATKCDNWKNYLNGDCDSNTKINMGFSTTNRGDYFLKTRDDSPYSLA